MTALWKRVNWTLASSAEVFAEVEGVGAAGEPVRRVEVGRVVAAHRRELVAEGLGEEALLHAAVVPAADELLLQLLVDALRAGVARRGHERRSQRGTQGERDAWSTGPSARPSATTSSNARPHFSRQVPVLVRVSITLDAGDSGTRW